MIDKTKRIVFSSIILLLTTGSLNAEVRNGLCGTSPEFAKKKGIVSPLFTSSERGRLGVVMLDGANPGFNYQDPSWRDAGSVGPIVVTEKGDIFFAPAPSINTLQNPFENQNVIYRIDSTTGKASKWLTLPIQRSYAPSQDNPFGIVGLSYDCHKKLLLCSSVSGSTANDERGTISVIDPRAATIVSTIINTDALGISSFYFKDRSWVVFGSARTPELYRIAWNTAKTLSRDREKIFSFSDGGNVRARKIISTQSGLDVQLTEFKYMLVGQSELRSPRLRIDYSESNDSFMLINQHERDFNPSMIPELAVVSSKG